MDVLAEGFESSVRRAVVSTKVRVLRHSKLDRQRLVQRFADAFPRPKHTAQAEVSFTSGQFGVLSERLTSYASSQAAESVMQHSRAAYQRCKPFDKTGDDGRVTHYVVASTTFERLGDDQVAFRLTFNADALSGAAVFVAARVDSLIMVTAGVSVSSTPGVEQQQPADFASFTNAAFERIASPTSGPIFRLWASSSLQLVESRG